MKIHAVIGSGFGDEGKGLITAHLASEYKDRALVARYSGGANAGHTVVHDGKRHVFHHLGSGAMTGAATYFGEHFISNPLLFEKELREITFPPGRIYCHNQSRITTPYDMLINQEIETYRGKFRHGSCGVGILETVKRSEIPHFTIRFEDLFDVEKLRKKLDDIKGFYVPHRLNLLRIDPSELFIQRLNDASLIERFIGACCLYHSISRPLGEENKEYKALILEGSQGLLLDERYGFFPYVTPASTGIRLASHLADRLVGRCHLEAVYVTRTYMTRHGPGPFPTEDKTLRYRDDTNDPNPWQGSLRFGNLDVPSLCKAIRDDLKCSALPTSASIAVTHLDQIIDPDSFLGDFTKLSRYPLSFVSYGPSTANVRLPFVPSMSGI